MLKTPCLHPEILAILANCGHGDKVLIADGNFPVDSNTHEKTAKIYLNLTQNIPLVTDVLRVINETIKIEKAEIMVPDDNTQVPIFSEFRELTSMEILDEHGRFQFYEACKSNQVKLAIATGDQRVYANILLTVGVV